MSETMIPGDGWYARFKYSFRRVVSWSLDFDGIPIAYVVTEDGMRVMSAEQIATFNGYVHENKVPVEDR